MADSQHLDRLKKVELITELAILKSLTERLLTLVQASEDVDLKRKVSELLGNLMASRSTPSDR